MANLISNALRERMKPEQTQASFAEQIGVSPQFLCEVLKGTRRPGKRILEYLGYEKHIVYRPIVRKGGKRRS